MKHYKKDRRLTEFSCDHCGKQEVKPSSEFNRNIKLNRKNFCSRSCSAKYNNASVTKVYKKERYDITLHAGSRKDDLTPFRYTFRNARKRYKNFTITMQDLKKQWDKQQGICPYSGVKLELPEFTKKVHYSVRASLDRIDSSKGYEVENIQFVSTMINLMKIDLSEEEVIKFRDQLVKNYCPCYQED